MQRRQSPAMTPPSWSGYAEKMRSTNCSHGWRKTPAVFRATHVRREELTSQTIGRDSGRIARPVRAVNVEPI